MMDEDDHGSFHGRTGFFQRIANDAGDPVGLPQLPHRHTRVFAKPIQDHFGVEYSVPVVSK